MTFAGCAGVVALDTGVRCELGDPRTLRLVVPRSAREIAIRAGSAGAASEGAVPSRVEEVGTASCHHVEVPPGADRVTVRATVDGAAASFTLQVGLARRVAWAEEAKALRASGELARARGLADAHAGAADDGERALAKDLLARIMLAEGHADDAFPLFREAITFHRKASRISDVVDDSFALAFALHQRSHRYAEAREALDAITRELALYPEGRAREPYYRGILASETGDRRAALALLRESEARAHALGMSRLERNARAALALEMQVLGRARASLDILRALERDPEVKGCERVEVANDLGWGALLANEAAGNPREDARGPLERAVVVEGCADVYLRSFALGNLARLALDEGNAELAADRLASARSSVKEPRGTERLSWLDLEARILLARRKPEAALARFDEELALARAGVLLEPEWSALVGRAEAFESLGKRTEAATALLAAEEVVDRAMLLVPLGEGRGAFVADRSRSARAAVDLLVALGRVEDAAHAAGRSRTRVLASVERALRIELLPPPERARWEAAVRSYRAAREALDADAAGDWKLPADALGRATQARKQREHALRTALEGALAVVSTSSSTSAPARAPSEDVRRPDDLDLLVHPGRKGWLAFASDGTGTTAHPVPRPEGASSELATALLGPIAARIRAAKRVRARTHGAWRNVDIHALAFAGAPLIDQLAVDYPLGGRGRTEQEPANAASGASSYDRRALVVGDPSGDLPGAAAEARAVATVVGPRMPVRLLVGAEATSSAVAGLLPRAGLLHYAGHGVFAGAEGWESALPLAEGSRLSIGDFLALAPAPRKIVLSGCDAARSAGETEGLGLAQALVAAGAEEVLAPVRPVSDALAARLAEALYAGATGDLASDLASPGTLAVAARAALRRLREQDPAGDWAAFRVLAR